MPSPVSTPVYIVPREKVRRSTKRKQEQTIVEPSYVETCLVQLCREERWVEVVRRCQYYPEEANPVPLPQRKFPVRNHFMKRMTIPSIVQDEQNKTTTLFRQTALGIACSSKHIASLEVRAAIIAMLRANPSQAGVSQYAVGHTPLREAILNQGCTGEIIQIILDFALRYPGGDAVLKVKDTSGLSPMDHIVGSIQLGSSFHCLDIMEVFVGVLSSDLTSLEENDTSPLIRLLTMGNSFQSSQKPVSNRTARIIRLKQKQLSPEMKCLERVLKATKILLDKDPALIYQRSLVTRCTPLHIALRNYGDFEPLIRELLERDHMGSAIRERNLYGDLPLHVACSTGVPSQVLTLVVERTAQASGSRRASYKIEPQINTADRGLLVWTVNNSGHTPVDLEWIHHVEPNNIMYTARQIHPSGSPRASNHSYKDNTRYRELLKEAVELVMGKNKSKDRLDGCERRMEAVTIFGSLLDRISLLVQAATNYPYISDTEATISSKLIASCVLSTPYSPALPLPILELFLWLRPDEVFQKDPWDMLPIHHALRYSETLSRTSLVINEVDEWRIFVFQLLEKSTEQCKAKCKRGRLPIHYVLDHSRNSDSPDSSSKRWKKLQCSREAIIEKLISMYPGSVDERDPVTGLYPFMMASMDQNLSVNTVFCLLRHSPNRCPPNISGLRS